MKKLTNFIPKSIIKEDIGYNEGIIIYDNTKVLDIPSLQKVSNDLIKMIKQNPDDAPDYEVRDFYAFFNKNATFIAFGDGKVFKSPKYSSLTSISLDNVKSTINTIIDTFNKEISTVPNLGYSKISQVGYFDVAKDVTDAFQDFIRQYIQFAYVETQYSVIDTSDVL